MWRRAAKEFKAQTGTHTHLSLSIIIIFVSAWHNLTLNQRSVGHSGADPLRVGGGAPQEPGERGESGAQKRDGSVNKYSKVLRWISRFHVSDLADAPLVQCRSRTKSIKVEKRCIFKMCHRVTVSRVTLIKL